MAVTLAPSARADGDDAVVVTAGGESMTIRDVERRLAKMPAFQRRTLGGTPAQVRKAFVDQVLVPEMLDAAEAKRRGLDKDPDVAERGQQMLARSVEEEIRDHARESGPTDAAIKRYYDAHRAQYDSPRRIRIWRIVVADEAAAKAILKEVQGKGQAGVTRWSQLARERSLDKATAMRDGDVGFVLPDGSSESGRVKVDAALFEAADAVKDGELVATPVKTKTGWAVVWRRGTLPRVHRSLADERVAIARQLEREAANKERRELLARLRRESVKDLHPELLKNIQVSSFGTLGTPGRPGGLPGRRGPRLHAAPGRERKAATPR